MATFKCSKTKIIKHRVIFQTLLVSDYLIYLQVEQFSLQEMMVFPYRLQFIVRQRLYYDAFAI